MQGLIGASALFVNFVEARLRLPDNKSILPCHGVGCNDCTRTTLDIQTGYPECGVATSGDFFSSDFQSDDRMSYDVWWDSEDPDPGCKIVINTPAITVCVSLTIQPDHSSFSREFITLGNSGEQADSHLGRTCMRPLFA